MHKDLKNFYEAGFCFESYANRLQWSDEIVHRAEPIANLEEETETERHIKMLEKAIQYYKLGDAWEASIRVSKVLANAHETQTYNLQALSAVLTQQSQLWRMIDTAPRVFHHYFLVSFRGRGFDDSTEQGKEIINNDFIFRSGNSKQLESVGDFTNRIKNKYPKAIIKNTTEPIPEQYSPEKFYAGNIYFVFLKTNLCFVCFFFVCSESSL